MDAEYRRENTYSVEKSLKIRKDKKQKSDCRFFHGPGLAFLYHKNVHPVTQKCSAGMCQGIFFFAIRESFQAEFCGSKDYFYKRFSAWSFIERTPDASCSL